MMTSTIASSVDQGDWIPITWLPEAPADASGRKALGLHELIEYAHFIASIDVTSPPALSALYRVLYALAARVTCLDREPESGEYWQDARDGILSRGRFDAAETAAYFARYNGRFDLFDASRPFLQEPLLAAQCAKSAGVNKLVVGRSAGNNHSWFGHHRDAAAQPVPRSAALLDLLTWLYYGPSGKCSARTVDGVSHSNTNAGPLRTALSYHPLGTSLFEVLVAGIPEPGEGDEPDDPCPWEREGSRDPRAPIASKGICSALTGRSQHAVLLVPDDRRELVVDAYITWASLGTVADGFRDPYLVWQFAKSGNLYARRADAGRALWRDLDSLQLHEGSDGRPVPRPPVFAKLPGSGWRVQALGFDQDGQAKDTQFVTGLTPPEFDAAVLRARVDDGRGDERLLLSDLTHAAEAAGFRLAYAAKKAWALYTNSKISDCAWSEQASARYWPLAEGLFWRSWAARDQGLGGLRAAFRRLAEPIFDDVTDGAARFLRGARAVEEARIELYGGRPKSAKPRTPKETSMAESEESLSERRRQHRAFIREIVRRCEDSNRPEARAALRAAVSKRWDAIPHKTFKYVADAGLPDRAGDAVLYAHYAVAAMIAAVPRRVELRAFASNAGRRRPDLGWSLAKAVTDPRVELSHDTAERQLDLLVKQSTAGLHRHLPPVVGRLAESPGLTDWECLLADLAAWPNCSDQISRAWLRSFYAVRNEPELLAAAEAELVA